MPLDTTESLCPVCQHDMTQTVACDQMVEWEIEGASHRRIPYGAELGLGIYVVVSECHDCGTPPGGLHHPGCDMEECPHCHEQAMGCDCTWAGDITDA